MDAFRCIFIFNWEIGLEINLSYLCKVNARIHILVNSYWIPRGPKMLKYYFGLISFKHKYRSMTSDLIIGYKTNGCHEWHLHVRLG